MIVVTIASIPAYAFNGHNGINFDMSQKEVEKLGFVCNPPKEKDPDTKANCEHMDMTGVAFGFPTRDYRVRIGSSGKVDMISSEFSVNLSTAEYIRLHSKIEHFFPTKDEDASFHAQGTARRDQWRAKNNAAAVLLLMNGIPPVTETSLGISFWSPRYMTSSDKQNK